MSDVIQLLEHDHREVEEMFAEFDKATDPKERRAIADKIIIELVRHSEAEEQAVYPAMKKALPDGEQLVEHEISEHSEAEEVMKKLDGMDPDDAQFPVLMARLQSAIREHIQEEETDAFPRFRQAVGPEELDKLAGTVQTLLRVVLPLTLPGLAVTAIYVFINAWGAFLVPLILDSNPNDNPGPIAIYNFMGSHGFFDFGQLAAFSLMFAVPVVVLYVIMSRFFSGAFSFGGAVQG